MTVLPSKNTTAYHGNKYCLFKTSEGTFALLLEIGRLFITTWCF